MTDPYEPADYAEAKQQLHDHKRRHEALWPDGVDDRGRELDAIDEMGDDE